MMSFLAETRIARLRPRGSKLILPTLVLFLAAFAASFFSFPEPWQQITLWSICGAISFFFWLLPVLKFFSTYLEITSTRVKYRAGLMGQRRKEISLSQIKDVQISRGRSISLIIEGQEPFSIRGIPKHKMVAVEIDRLAASL
ncbi:MAG: PH domain-containing protein [Actinobacteria bacterium]|nr:PH domain-containing protein [Actinomycetota bacterium]